MKEMKSITVADGRPVEEQQWRREREKEIRVFVVLCFSFLKVSEVSWVAHIVTLVNHNVTSVFLLSFL